MHDEDYNDIPYEEIVITNEKGIRLKVIIILQMRILIKQ